MKKIKKLIAIGLAAVMVMALGSMAFAAETATGTSSDTGTITVNGLESGVTVSAYQIAKATYDESTGLFTGYEMITTSGWTIESDGTYTDPTEADLAELWTQVSSSTATGSAVADSDGTAEIKDLPVGSYLLVATGSEATVYSMMIGSVSYTVTDDGWVTDNGSISVEGTNTWVKAAKPSIDKEEVGSDGNDTHGGSAEIGDEVTFHITVDNIPHYDGSYPEFDVDDVLSGLTITDDELANLTVTVVDESGATVAMLVRGTDYSASRVGGSASEFDVNFVVNGKYTLNDYAGKSLVIEYKATVSETTESGGTEDHNNHATLTFSTNSYVSGSDNEGNEPGDTSHEYSFSASFTKTGTDEGDENGLAGATFTIYDEDGSTHGTATSGENGTVTFTGLKEGTYTFTETKAPAGYVLDTTEYTLTVAATYSQTDGTLTSWSVTIKNGDATVGTATGTSMTNATIENTHIASGALPSTGGRGTLIFTLIGCAIVACAVAGVVISRRRRTV